MGGKAPVSNVGHRRGPIAGGMPRNVPVRSEPRRGCRSDQSMGDMSVVANQKRAPRSLLMAGAVAVPVAIVSLYIIASRAPFQSWAHWTYYLSLGAALVSGAYFVWRLVPQAGWRTAVLIAYAVGCTGVLLMFSLIFTCAVYRDCL